MSNIKTSSAESSASTLAVTLTIAQLQELVRNEIKSELAGTTHDERLIDVNEAAKLLSVSKRWLYKNGRSLPFSVQLGDRFLRFSYQGIQKWLFASDRLPGQILPMGRRKVN